MASVSLLIAICALLEWIIFQLDIKTAFLNGPVEEELFIEQAEGFVVKGKVDWVCLLQKSLYGLKQTSRNWNNAFTKKLQSLGFKQLISEPCFFQHVKKKIMLVIYVDDILVAVSNQSSVDG